MLASLLVLSTLLTTARAHFAAWAIGMYCLKGTEQGADNIDNNAPVNPLFQLHKEDWWFHHVNNCDEFPPDEGDFLELPANSEFTVELATNRAFTTLGRGAASDRTDGFNLARFGDGEDHPEFDQLARKGELTNCITAPNIHTQNESMAAGTVFAISYNSAIADVTPESLVVFTALYYTPWYRLATYEVPNLPACPADGCICAWGWVANGCGEPNMYMQGFKCKVVGETGGARLAPARPPVWCEDDAPQCVQGAKQMVFWNQLDGNNVQVSGLDLSGQPRSPGYNMKMGFANGRQTDIFDEDGTATTTSITPTSTTFGPANPDGEGDGSVYATLDRLCIAFRYLSILFFLPFLC